jgi:hypothetical protein
MIVNFSRVIFSCGTHVFVYAFVHVMCLCVYVSMVCQRCMLYDDMYSHDRVPKLGTNYKNRLVGVRQLFVPLLLVL